MKTGLIAAAIAGALVLVGGLVYAGAPVALPPPSGPDAIASQALDLPIPDAALPTPIAQIWYPADAKAGAFPVLIYLPSWTGTEIEDLFLIRDLVSHGYAVVGLRYPTAAEVARARAGGPALRPERAGDMNFTSDAAFAATLSLADDKVRARARNVAAVLDRLQNLNEDPTSPLHHRLDLGRIGAWGFSLGGAAAAQAAWLDHRIKAASNLDGWLFAEAAAQGVPCPYLLIGDGSPVPTAEDLDNPKTHYSALLDMQDLDRQIAGLQRYGGYFATIDGSTHLNFTDGAARSRLRRLTGAGPIDPRRALVITADYLRAFFDAVLRGKPSPLLVEGTSPYPELHLKVFAGHGRT